MMCVLFYVIFMLFLNFIGKFRFCFGRDVGVFTLYFIFIFVKRLCFCVDKDLLGYGFRGKYSFIVYYRDRWDKR